jgi:hypothetical protein
VRRRDVVGVLARHIAPPLQLVDALRQRRCEQLSLHRRRRLFVNQLTLGSAQRT